MKRIQKTSEKNTLGIAFVFLLFVGFLIITSIFIKGVALVNQSSFDGHHRFTLLINPSFKNESQAKSQIISFAPDTNTISIITIAHRGGRLEQNDIKKKLKIPIDAVVYPSLSNSDSIADMNMVMEEKNIESTIWYILTHNTPSKNMTIVDLFRLWLFTKTIPAHAIVSKEITISKKMTPLEELVLSQLITKLFVDYSLSKEKVSIQIVNGAGVIGLGGRMAEMITNMGGNVVDVSTADSILSSSEILYSGQATYTSSKLSKLFGIKSTQVQNDGISDIIIRIGTDIGSESAY